MKKINLIERLWTDSHEKQSPQRFGRYAAMLIMLLTLGVGQMWADNTHVIAVAGENPNNYTVKVESDNGGAGKWMYTFSRASAITFEGKKLYVGSYNEKYGGVDNLWIHYYDGDDWISKCTPFSGWTTSLNDDQVYNKDNCSWYAKKTVSVGARVYFQPDANWTETTNKIWVGHANYQRYYSMSRVTNTQLYYGTIVTNGWNNAMGIGVVGNTSASDGTNYFTNAATNSSEYTGLKNWDVNNTSANNAYLIVSNGDAGEEPTMSYHASHYANNALNYTLTMKYAVSTNGATPAELTSGYIPATITVSTYKFSNGKYDAVDASSLAAAMTKNGSTYSSSATAARTAATTFAVSSIDGDYAFLGWYTAASGGTLLSSDETYTTYLPTESATIYARFSHENNHAVAVTYVCTETSANVKSAENPKVGEITPTTFTAGTPNGYSFTSWTVGNGLTITSGSESTNSISVKTKSSGTFTLQANYNEVLTTNWKLIGDNSTNSPFGDNYSYASGKAMSKKSGASATDKAYKTLDVTHTGTWYFKVSKAAGGDSYNYAWGTGDNKVTYNRSYSGTKHDVYTGSQNPLQFVPDALGEYEFEVDYTSTPCSVKVTFPATTYTVTYNIGSVAGTSGSISATYSSVAFASGTKVQSGKSVTLTGPAPKTGYTWKGWYTNAAGTEGKIADVSRAITVTVNAAKSLYACYTENQYNTTVAVSPAGTKATTSPAAGTVAIKQVTGTEITASAATDSIFEDWTISGGGLTMVSSSTTNPNTFKATNTGGTITANFTPQWTIAGSMYDNFNWSKTSNLLTGYNTISSKKHATKTISLAANTTYTFKVKDRSQTQDNGWYGIASGSTATYTYANDNTAKAITTASGNQNISLTTAAAGDYVFDFNVTDKQIAVDFPTSWKMTIGQKTVYDPNVSNTSDASTTGGYVTAEDDASNTITNNKYVANNASVTFTAHPAPGYAFKGWYKNADCSTSYIDYSDIDGSVIIDNEAMTLTLNNIGENKGVYAKYEEIMTTISVSAYHGTFKIDSGEEIEEMGIGNYLEVGVHTTHDITVMTDDEGFYFSNWDLHTAISCEDEGKEINFSITGDKDSEDNRSVTVTGLGRADGCSLDFITLQYKSLETIHFRNRFDDGTNPATHWENVYVYFDVTWVTHSGQQALQTSEYNSSKGLHVAMTNRGYHDMWWAYVPRWVTRENKYQVAFANFEMTSDNYKFYLASGGCAVGRSDYREKTNMFVPYHTSDKTVNSVKYYDNGYWMRYTTGTGAESGYYVERRTASKTYSRLGEFIVNSSAWDDATIQYRLRVDGMTKTDYIIWSEGNIKYKTWTGVTTAKCDTVALKEDNTDDSYFVITLTSEGEYILTIDQSGDRMKLSVNYPVAVNDYVLEHTYTGKKKTDPEVDSTYVTRTNIIKAADAATKTRYSMYLNKKDATLKLRKCTSISAGKPVWSTGSTTNVDLITDSLTKNGNGVYQFDMSVSGDAISEVDSVRLYTGNFYIKTDAADGGWVNYKRNALTKNTVNFDRSDASTFDNYMCKYYASKDCNIKSVIANDYCNQLSDTVKGDGIARMYAGEPYVPIDGTSIRFSYNSATNETKRAYLGASYHNGYLNIVPNSDNKIYRTIDETPYDLYDYRTDSAKLKFVDNGNWVYEMDLSVIPGAEAGVRAVYNTTHTQMLIPLNNTLLGGDGSGGYGIRVVYDFKTNFMMSAFVLTDTPIDDNLSDFDMLWVRHKDESPTQLTLGEGSLSHVRPIGAIEFKYNEMCSSAEHTDSWVDLSAWNQFSRPYLKYFISFPFDVHVGSIFGLNDAYYGLDYVIQKYDGATRAKDGLFGGDGDNYWIDLTKDSIMHANEGYCFILDNDYARWSSSSDMWYNKSAGSSAFVYFPAMDEIASIGEQTEGDTNVPEHECTVNRWWSGSKSYLNHTQTDSHWNLIGQPFFHDAYMKNSSDAIDTLNLASYYYLDYSDNKWHIQAFNNEHNVFKAMSSFFVQWAGDITWTTNSANDKWKDVDPKTPAPRRAKAEEGKNYLIRLDIEFNDKVSDWAFVRLEDHANEDFVLREDMFKMYNNGIPNVYTFAGDYDAAYNAVPIKSQTIPVGVIARKNGTYTFSMPSNFSGTVTLVDKFDGTRTNLAMEDYEVYLEKGTIDDRFELEINVNKMPTAIDGTEDGSGSLKDGKAHKFIENGVMYIIENGRIYDAQGNRVK